MPRSSVNKVVRFLRVHRAAWMLLLVLSWGARLPVLAIHHVEMRATSANSARRARRNFIAKPQVPADERAPSAPPPHARDRGLTANAAARSWEGDGYDAGAILPLALPNRTPHRTAVIHPPSAPVYLRRGVLLI